MSQEIKGISLASSCLIFGAAAAALLLETQFLIPFLSRQTGLEPVVFWFIVAGLGMFLPLLILARLILKNEGFEINKNTWRERLRFKPMNAGDWLWSFGAIVIIAAAGLGVIKLLEMLIGTVENNPPFMRFEPLTAGRYWILLVWLPFWLLNIISEEILWRGVLLPRQEVVFGKKTWLVHGALWGIFHIAFGWQLLLTLTPILFIQSYAVQRRKNSWVGVVIHAVINGPSFVAIAMGWL